VTVLSPVVALSMTAAFALSIAQPAATTTPGETFHLSATASPAGAAEGSVTAKMVIRIDRYTPEHAITTMTDGLKYGGYPGFLKALREAPPAGSLAVAGRRWVIRWARQVPEGTERAITLVTDKPVFFIGSGLPDAKSTAGFEVAVVELRVDEKGAGMGTMAAAARVRPGGDTGVRIDNYAASPLALVVEPPPHK